MRVAICCKEGLFADGLAALLDRQGSIEVVAVAASSQTLVASAKDRQTQAMIVDADSLSREELQFLLGARAFGDFVVILLASADRRAEADGLAVDRVVNREDNADKLFDALSEMKNKVPHIFRPYVGDGRRRRSKDQRQLSPREYECAQLVAKGLSNRKIAALTGLREQSIKNLVSVIMRKLQCENRVQVALKLTQVNYMPPIVSEELAGI